jgi:UrcA family protein
MTASIRTAVLALAMLTLAAVEVLPAQADAAPQWTVRLSDLDVNSSAGIQELYRRLQFAAGQVCGGAPHAADTLVAYYRCRNAALSRAIADAGLPLLTRFDSERSRQRGLLARR